MVLSSRVKYRGDKISPLGADLLANLRYKYLELEVGSR